MGGGGAEFSVVGSRQRKKTELYGQLNGPHYMKVCIDKELVYLTDDTAQSVFHGNNSEII